MAKASAGILLFRRSGALIEVLLGHMGGPYWQKKDLASWTIPKGEFNISQEEPLAAAIREFEEETGKKPVGDFIELTPIKQSGGKRVYAWGLEGDLDPETFRSNTFEMEWPPKSGKQQSFPELDRVEWFGIEEAKTKILKGQMPLLVDLERQTI